VDDADEHGWAALHYAASGGHTEACKVLLEFKANMEVLLPDRSTPLMLAAEEAQISVIRLLLEHGASTKCRDEDGFTVLERCDPEVVQEFLRWVTPCNSGREGA